MTKHYFHCLLIFLCASSFAQVSQKDSLTLSKEMYEWEKKSLAFKESQPALALEYLFKALSIAQTIKDEDSEGFYITYQGTLYKNMGQFEEAIKSYEKGIELQRKIENWHGEAGNYHNIAWVYRLQGKYQLSLEYSLKALETFTKLDRKEQIATTYNAIGNLYADQKNYHKATENFLEALKLAENIKDTSIRANTFAFLGDMYSKKIQTDSATYFFTKAIELYKQKNEKRGLARAKMSMAKMYLQNKEVEPAIQLLQEAQEIYNTAKDLHGVSQTLQELALAYELLGQKTKAYPLYLKSLEISEQIGTKPNSEVLYQRISEYFAQERQFEKAYTYLQKAKQMKDSLVKIEDMRTMNELQAKYDYQDQKYKISLLEKENEISDSQKSMQRNIFAFLVVLFLSGLGFLWYRYRNKQRYAKVLEEKNLAIAESLAQREMLLKEIHHRVKNNLQIVSSLLSLQVDNAEQKSSEEILQLSQSRIQAMAIIHEKLYQSDNLKSISLKEYVENLITYFERSYDLEKQKIKVNMQIEDIFLDIDVLVPCGLILNELITNSIKYAFKEQESGMISIRAIQKDKVCQLDIADNGVGIPIDFNLVKANSLGLKLVKGFAKQIKGIIKTIQQEKGTCFQVVFQT